MTVNDIKLIENFKRDENGLLTKPIVPYEFNEDGSIDWRSMIRKEFLVPNKERTKETDVTKLEDKDLIILLGGIKELAQIRGYTDVNYSVNTPNQDYVAAVCSIKFIANYETGGREITFSAIGDASPFNTKDFAKNYLGPIAENRAFCRCVRNFLKINIVAQEELGKSKDEEKNAFEPSSLLGKVMKEKNISFDAVKKRLIKENYPNAAELTSIDEIPKIKIFELLDRITKA
jgi:hypothetical protein